MRSLALAVLSFVACAPAPGPVVSAPLVTAAMPHDAAREQVATSASGSAGPRACADAWVPDIATEQVVVVCGGDVRRRAFDDAGEIARSIAPALDRARERVCACAARVTPPPHVDLSVRASPDDGRVTVEITDPEGDLDPTLGPEFAACFGTLVSTYAPFHLAVCASGFDAVIVYPVRVDLGS